MNLTTIQALFLLYSAISLVAGILIASLFFRKKDASATLWIYGCLFTSIATSVTVFRNEIPLVISYSLVVSFEVLSILLFSQSLKKLSIGSIPKKISWPLFLIPAGFFLLIELGRYSANGLITPELSAISTLVFGIANLLCLYETFTVRREFSNRFFFSFLAVIFLLASLLYFLRVFNVFSGYSGYAFDLKPYNLAIWFFLTLLNSIRNLTYVALRLQLGLTEHSRLNNMNLRLSHTLEERNGMILSLQKLNRSSSINALASTISHEINQPLGALMLNVQYFDKKIESDPSNIFIFKEICKSMLDDVNRASTIIKNLSRLSSNQNNHVSVINLAKSITQVIDISNGRLRSSNTIIELDCRDNLQISLNMSEWQQVLINIINNALDALDSTDSKSKKIQITAISDQSSIKVFIQDNGHGIKTGEETKIFELMVSNKQTGSGIGLWLSKNIINRHGGDITAYNAKHGGACFVIELPIT